MDIEKDTANDDKVEASPAGQLEMKNTVDTDLNNENDTSPSMLDNKLFAEEQEADKTDIVSPTAVEISVEKDEESLNRNETS